MMEWWCKFIWPTASLSYYYYSILSSDIFSSFETAILTLVKGFCFVKLLKKNLSIEEFIWKINLNKLDRSDPFAITKFEKMEFSCINNKNFIKYINDYNFKNTLPLHA